MRILIEDHHYQKDDVLELLKDSGINPSHVEKDTKLKVDYVGYFYNHKIDDCVFILPKVIVDEKGKVDESLSAEDLLKLHTDVENEQKQNLLKFVYGFSVWMYRAISVYREKNPDTDISISSNITQMGKGKRRERYTFLDVILEILDFNRNNQDYLTFIVKNQHRGLNKINWTRTISKSQAIIQGKEPVYLNPVNKKRVVNFDEELLIIYYSILNYINKQYGFDVRINVNYDLIKGDRFKTYINGLGCARLRQIKYKYFSDKALRIWELCFAFFDSAYKIQLHRNVTDNLLVHDFHAVFEDMIDELIGDDLDKELEGLKKQEDGKQLDHIYRYYGLTDNTADEIYYIGDSKYYPRGTNKMGVEPISKQYTYARNLIQHNLNLFLDKQNGIEHNVKYIQEYRDSETEGYDIVPNFFISARIEKLDNEEYFHNYITPKDTKDGDKFYISRHFENRIFDRDTILISHYVVNFLYVIALYSRDNSIEKQGWKNEVRAKFRERIIEGLNETYQFYVMTPLEHSEGVEKLQQNFKEVVGKVYKPYPLGVNGQRFYSLALQKPEKIKNETLKERVEEENKNVRAFLEQYFEVIECNIGEDKRKDFQTPPPDGTYNVVAEELALLITKEGINYDNAIQKAQATQKVGIALKMDGAVLQLVEGFTKAKYLIIHNKGMRYSIYGLKGIGPKLVTAKDAENMVVTKMDEDLYLVYEIDIEKQYNIGELDLTPATVNGNGYNPQLLPLSILLKKEQN